MKRMLRAVGYQLGRPARWWTGLEPPERVFYRAAALLAAGCGLVWLPFAFIVPGLLWALLFFGFTFKRGS